MYSNSLNTYIESSDVLDKIHGSKIYNLSANQFVIFLKFYRPGTPDTRICCRVIWHESQSVTGTKKAMKGRKNKY